MTSSKLLIYTSIGPKIIEAEIHGAFAIHPTRCMNESTGESYEHPYKLTLTHIFTGLAVLAAKDRETLDLLKEELEALLDWHTMNPLTYASLSQEMRLQCSAVMRRYRDEGEKPEWL